MTEPVIQFIDVHKSFESTDGKTQKVLKGTSFSILPGRTTVIGGGSGQGKSVTIRLILGLMKADSGRIIVEGKDITHMSSSELNEVRSSFGVVFQGVAPFDSMTVFENVAPQKGAARDRSAHSLSAKAAARSHRGARVSR